MDYRSHYNKLIQKSIDRTKDKQKYYEQHHIIPKCMDGNDDSDNLVYLLPEEHYIAHLLLVKIYPNEYKLIYAANMMANRNNKSYGWIKRKFSQQNSIDHTGRFHTEESKIKMRNSIRKRRENDPEKFSEEQKRRASRPKLNKTGYFKSKSESHAKNISEAAKNRPRVQCEVCGKEITKANVKNHMKVHINVSI